MRYQFIEDGARRGGGGRGIGQYILIDRNTPVPADTMTWARWMEIERPKPIGESLWRVGQNTLPGYFNVSTIFLGLDHGMTFMAGGHEDGYRPVLFETMAFDRIGREPRTTWLRGRGQRTRSEFGLWRCCTWAEAEARHAAVIQAVRKLGKYMHAARMAGDKRLLGRLHTELWEMVP